MHIIKSKVIGWLLSLTAKALPVIFDTSTEIRCNHFASFLHNAKSPETQAQTSVFNPGITKASIIVLRKRRKKRLLDEKVNGTAIDGSRQCQDSSGP